MLAYYVERHMRRALAPLLFDDNDPADADATRYQPVEPARPSASARAKAGSKRTPSGLPVHSFQTLFADLATLTRNRIQPVAEGAVGRRCPHQSHPPPVRSLPLPRRPPMARTQ